MKARPLFLCVLSAALCAIPAPAQDEAKPEAPKADKSGQVEKRRQEMLKRFDLNGDGKLDDEENAAKKEALKQEKEAAKVRGSGDIGSMTPGGAPGEPRPGPGAGPSLYIREMLKRFDKDGDGKLDEAELGEMLKARAAAGGGQGMAGGQARQQIMKMFDKNGDGKIDDEERVAAEKFRDEQVKRFDKNGDGQLDQEERAEALKAYLADHPELVPPGN